MTNRSVASESETIVYHLFIIEQLRFSTRETDSANNIQYRISLNPMKQTGNILFTAPALDMSFFPPVLVIVFNSSSW